LLPIRLAVSPFRTWPCRTVARRHRYAGLMARLPAKAISPLGVATSVDRREGCIATGEPLAACGNHPRELIAWRIAGGAPQSRRGVAGGGRRERCAAAMGASRGAPRGARAESIRPGSVAAARGDDDAQRPGDDREVAPEAPRLDVIAVEGDAAGVIDVVAAADLPRPGQPRPRPQIVVDVFAVARHLGDDDRPRPDNAHLAFENVEQLRQLVEAGLAHRRAERGDARVVLELLQRAPLLGRVAIDREMALQHPVGIEHHRAEFQAVEGAAVKPDA